MEVLAPPVPRRLEAGWQAAAAATFTEKTEKPRPGNTDLREQFYGLITCREEKHPVDLLGRFLGEGLECKAVLGPRHVSSRTACPPRRKYDGGL